MAGVSKPASLKGMTDRPSAADCNIEPPASPYAIMRRVHPYRGENSGPARTIVGELDTQTRN
jgi:hypothetical protein